MMRKLGITLTVIPLAILLLFTLGEVTSGDISGLSHLFQALPLVIIFYLAVKQPLVGLV